MKIKFTVFIFTISSLFIVSAVSAQQAKRPRKKTFTSTASNGKIIYEPDAEMLKNLQAKVRVVESKQDWAEFDRQAPLVSPAKTRTVYTAKFRMESDAENFIDVVIVHDSQTDKFYEIRGIDDFPWRPFSDFKWISNDILQFEQWVNPNNGGRYQVNLKTGKIIAAGYVRSN